MSVGDKAVLFSVKPWWVSMIATGKKTVEVRKTRPKLDTPFKVYIYQTLPRAGDFNERDGRVVGEFICDSVDRYARIGTTGASRTYYMRIDSEHIAHCIDYDPMCLTPNEFAEYGDGKELYGLHISNLELYKYPRPLFNFKLWNGCLNCKQNGTYHCLQHCTGRFLERAPMSWCYVEEIDAAVYIGG